MQITRRDDAQPKAAPCASHRVPALTPVLIGLVGLSAALAPPTLAWKVKTHVYSANLLLQEVQGSGGYVEIPPYGRFAVLPEYLSVITKYPSYFRAGTVGPDLVPDIYTAQVFYHPDKSYEYLEHYWQTAKRMQPMDFSGLSPALQVQAEPFKAWADPASAQAYMLGFSVHAAGDYFGHSWVNKWAGGPWPELDDGVSTDDERNIMRHNAIEGFVDDRIPAVYQMPTMNTLEFPLPFIRAAMMDDLQTYERLTGSKPQHLALFEALRALVANHTNDIWPIGAYARNWVEDIDSGLGAWFSISIDLAKASVQPKWAWPPSPGLVAMADEKYSTWVNDHLYSMLGAPDFVGAIAGFIGDILDALPQPLKDVKAAIRDFFISKSLEAIYGTTLDEVKALGDDPASVVDNPTYFPSGSRAGIEAEMRNFATASTAVTEQFAPFYNTILFAKLNLIGLPGMLELKKRAGAIEQLPPGVPEGDMLLECASSFDKGYTFKSPGMFPQALSRTAMGQAIARQIFNFGGTAPKPRISDAPTEPVVEQWSGTVPVWATFVNAPPGASIGVYYSSPTSLTAMGLQSLYDQPSGNYSMEVPLGTPSGDYQLRMTGKDGSVLAVSPLFHIQAATAPAAPAAPEFSGLPVSPAILPGEGEVSRQYAVTYCNPPKVDGTIVGLFDASGAVIDWAPASQKVAETFVATVPWGIRPGKHSFRMYDKTGRLLAKSADIEFRYSGKPFDPTFSGESTSPVELSGAALATELKVNYSGAPTGDGVTIGLYASPTVPTPARLPWEKTPQPADSSPAPGAAILTDAQPGSAPAQAVRPTVAGASALDQVDAALLEKASRLKPGRPTLTGIGVTGSSGKGLGQMGSLAGASNQWVIGGPTDGQTSGTFSVKIPATTLPGRYEFRMHDVAGTLSAVSRPISLVRPKAVQSDSGTAPPPSAAVREWLVGPAVAQVALSVPHAEYTVQRVSLTSESIAPQAGEVGLLVDLTLRDPDTQAWRTLSAGDFELQLRYSLEEVYAADAVWVRPTREPLGAAVIAPGIPLDLRALFHVPEGRELGRLEVNLTATDGIKAQATIDLTEETGLKPRASVPTVKGGVGAGIFSPAGDLDLAVSLTSATKTPTPRISAKRAGFSGLLAIALRNPGPQSVRMETSSVEVALVTGDVPQEIELGPWLDERGEEATDGFLLPGRQVSLKATVKAVEASADSSLQLTRHGCRPIVVTVTGPEAVSTPASPPTIPAPRASMPGLDAQPSILLLRGPAKLRFQAASAEISVGSVKGSPWSAAPSGDEQRLVCQISVTNASGNTPGTSGGVPVDLGADTFRVFVLDEACVLRQAEATALLDTTVSEAPQIQLAPDRKTELIAYFTLPSGVGPSALYVGDAGAPAAFPLRLVTARAAVTFPRPSALAPEVTATKSTFYPSGDLELAFGALAEERAENGTLATCQLTVRRGDRTRLAIGDEAPLAVFFELTSGIALEADIADAKPLKGGLMSVYTAVLPQGAALKGVYAVCADITGARAYYLGAR